MEDTYDVDMSRMLGDLMIAYKHLRLDYSADRITEQEFNSKLRALMIDYDNKWQARVFKNK